ncbi:hypothetical protein [Oceanobacillus saliphilus]|nr:hypothetical protein [Oceanobacillus saliphilus]
MYKNQMITFSNTKAIEEGYKVIEVNVSDSTESLYAVCTPVKK